MGSAPGSPHCGVSLCCLIEHPSGSVSGEASDTAASEPVGSGKIVVEIGRCHGKFVVPSLVAVDAVGGSAHFVHYSFPLQMCRA